MSIPVQVKDGEIYIKDATLAPKGYEQLTSLLTVQSLTVPGTAQMVLLQSLDHNVRWRDDGVAPTATVGMRISAGEEFWYTGNLAAIQFIEEAPSAVLNAAYYTAE